MITKILKNALDKKNLIGITTPIIDWDKSIIGYVTYMDDESFTINEVDRYGRYNGNTTIAIKDVCYIDFNTTYIQDIIFIQNHNSTFNPDARVTVWGEGKNLIKHFQYLKESDKIAKIFFEEENFVFGTILDFDKEFILIKSIWKDGLVESIGCYRINDIEGLRYDDLSEQKTKLLFDSKYNDSNIRTEFK